MLAIGYFCMLVFLQSLFLLLFPAEISVMLINSAKPIHTCPVSANTKICADDVYLTYRQFEMERMP